MNFDNMDEITHILTIVFHYYPWMNSSLGTNLGKQKTLGPILINTTKLLCNKINVENMDEITHGQKVNIANAYQTLMPLITWMSKDNIDDSMNQIE